MKVTNSHNEMRSGDCVVAIFMPYKGDNRCAKCCFSDNKCKEAPCTPEERKDNKQGFWRFANQRTSEYTVSDAFKPLLR